MIIGFQGYKITCIIGELPQERVEEQEIEIDLKVEIDFLGGDDLEDTVDYTRFAHHSREIAVEGKFRLLEAYADAVLNRIFEYDKVKSATITVKKPKAIPGALFAFAELKR